MEQSYRSGGLDQVRQIDREDLFESTIEDCFGDDVREYDSIATDLWCALTNIKWIHREKNVGVFYSYRAAGDLVAAIRQSGDYLDWYCCGPSAVISDHIKNTLTEQGWTFTIMKE